MAQHVALLVVNVICLGLAIAGQVSSLTGYSWWKTTDGREEGLWRTCIKVPQGDWDCDLLDDIFDFDKNLKRTVVILLLIISSGLLFLSLILALTMCYCFSKKCLWTCGSVLLMLMSFGGGGSGFASLIYAEVTFEDKFSSTSRGWSNIVGWVGSSIGIVTCLLSLLMCCLKPKQSLDVRYNSQLHGGRQSYINNSYQV